MDAIGWAGLHLVVAVCVLVLVPLGLGVLGRGRWLVRWWPVVAVPAAVSVLVPRGVVAGLLCVPWLVGCLAVPLVLRRERMVAFAGACLPVAAVGMVAERFGYGLFGFPAGVLALTAAHFQVAGFGALLLLAVAVPVDSFKKIHTGVAIYGPPSAGVGEGAAPAQGDPPTSWVGEAGARFARFARVAAPSGVALVGAGFLIGRTPLGENTGDVIELIGAGVLTAGLWIALGVRAGLTDGSDAGRVGVHPVVHAGSAVRTDTAVRADSVVRAEPGNRGARRVWPARALLALGVVTMSLALLYAAGQVTDIPHLNLTWMVLTHGVLNAAAVLTALATLWAAREQPWSEHRWSHRIGNGRARFEAASSALLAWDMHRRAGARVEPSTPPATTGQRMLSRVGVGRLRVPEPCEVIEVVRDPDRTVMHYRTLPGHTFNGDERFTVRLDGDGTVRFEVHVRSQPVLLIARLAGPLVPLVQRLFIARCAAALRNAHTPAAAPR